MESTPSVVVWRVSSSHDDSRLFIDVTGRGVAPGARGVCVRESVMKLGEEAHNVALKASSRT